VDLFDILGPVMVGPSSSHTAGAVRMGLMARSLLCDAPARAKILLHGSFAATGAGHGTDRALVAGLLGMAPDDPRIPQSLALARQRGLVIGIGAATLRGAHPNSAHLALTGQGGGTLELRAASLGGGRIRVDSLDGLDVSFTGDARTLIVYHRDLPGQVADTAGLLAQRRVNIASMHLYRDQRGGRAIMVLLTDQDIPPDLLTALRGQAAVEKVIYLDGQG
jgi:L-serine dehydratase